jgi:hypothetical protein
MNEERCDLLCLDAPRAEGIRGRLIDVETAGEAAERARMFSDARRLLGRVGSYACAT